MFFASRQKNSQVELGYFNMVMNGNLLVKFFTIAQQVCMAIFTCFETIVYKRI
jgi:hypothetical protein